MVMQPSPNPNLPPPPLSTPIGSSVQHYSTLTVPPYGVTLTVPPLWHHSYLTCTAPPGRHERPRLRARWQPAPLSRTGLYPPPSP